MSIIGAAIATFGSGGIFYVGAGASDTGTNISLPVPTGYAAGDLLVICGSNKSPTPEPAGWTTVVADATGTVEVFVFIKTATSSESAVTVGTTNSDAVGIMLCYRGTNVANIGTTGTVATSTSASPATTSITTTVPSELVLSVYACLDADVRTWTAPGATNERVNVGSTSTTHGVLVVDELKSAAGATSTRTATLSASTLWDAVAVSFKPA